MFSKQHIFDALDGYFSKVGIKLVDGEWRLVGKWCEIVPLEDGNWDIWFHNVQDVSKPISRRKLSAIKAKLPRDWAPVELTEEMWIQVSLAQLIAAAPSLRGACGIQKKQTYSDEYMKKLMRNFD